MSSQGACEVCGRTFLVGEQVHSYVSVGGRHEVCELCAGRAAALGWLPADEEGAEEAVRARAGRRQGMFARLFGRPRREEGDGLEERGRDDEGEAEGRDEAEEPDMAEEPEKAEGDGERGGDVTHEGVVHGGEGDAVGADAPPAPRPDPAERGMRPRRLQPDLSPVGRFERAVARFNGSPAGRTAAGLTRTLGAPSVSVGDLAGDEDVVRITVAWELTWYQWGVDLGDELRPVFELGKGFEIEEIDRAARQWNASAQDGRIVLIAPPRRDAETGRPVPR